MTESVAGQIEKIVFHDPESGFSVIALKTKTSRDLVTAVGNFGRPALGELVTLTGSYSKHPKFGLRFEVATYEAKPPDLTPDLKKYLGSGLIPGLGPVLAARVVDKFGAKTLTVLDQEPERLIEVPGLGAVKREKIIESWRSTMGLRRLLKFLATFGLGPALAQKIFRRFGATAEETIRKDPYQLAFKVEGVGFKKADQVAKALGWADDDPKRLEAILLVTLNDGLKQGDVYRPLEELIRVGASLAPTAKPEDLSEALKRLSAAAEVKLFKLPTQNSQDVYLQRFFRAEAWTAREILNISRAHASVTVPRPTNALKWAESTLGLALGEDQKAAVLGAITQKAVVVTGGPGTGKTTIALAICRIWRAVTEKIALCAPTGRAAKRLSQATGLEATTIHRLLEYSPKDKGFAKGPGNHLDLDMLLVDEASMLDILMSNQLFGALPNQATLILVGDRDQLPPVGPGRVLADIMDSGVIPVYRLTTIYRQGERSLITEAAHLINRGQTPDSLPKGPEVDFHFVEENDPLKVQDKILRLVVERVPLKRGLDPLTEVQVLCPIRLGDLGTQTLGELLGQALNKKTGPSLTHYGRTYKVGDRVIQVRNNYKRGVFNGDLGFVVAVDKENQELTVEFDLGRIVYQILELDELAPAWALTVHKAQGSEFPAVIMPLHYSHYRVLRRQLLYTAVTRGRRLVMLVGSKAALNKAVTDASENLRRGHLADFLVQGPPPLNSIEDVFGDSFNDD
ncbi:MAG: ATP-dependent RecD-like DNA helicase [Deltaproteobacteria bacterium]|jgi:exodeoxyribonuclease V alpha subunit|nr:ATP-dependent RecD-like DNA helicase [Deltaproteobacteria bacterium]